MVANINPKKKKGKSEVRKVLMAYGFAWSLLSVSILSFVAGYYLGIYICEWES